ncbi:hypothetical protein [Luteimonas sp. TWI1416]
MFVILLLLSSCASVHSRTRCRVASEQVSIQYKGLQRIAAWGKEELFASFSIENSSSEKVEIPLDRSDYPLLAHGEYIELQSRLRSQFSDWQADAISLEEFVPPRKWIVLEKGESFIFFFNASGQVDDHERSEERDYRVGLNDAAGCRYNSDAFRFVAE